jgi:UDP-glucuronate decarboxylase
MKNLIISGDLEKIYEDLGETKLLLSGSTILITGCAGFLGFYALQFLLKFAEDLNIKKVIGLDIFLLSQPSWVVELQRQYSERFELLNFDISKGDIASINDIESVNYVIHAASIAAPIVYRQYPIETIDANIWGLRSLLDYFKNRKSLKGFLFFSSSEVYGDPCADEIPTKETYFGNVSFTGPRSCYDESKRFGETLCWIYATQFNMPVTVARPFNNYGPGMRLDDQRLPADFAKAVTSGKNIVILSDGSPTRTFCYISDAMVGYLLCMLHGKYDNFNVGIDGPEIPVLEFANIFRNEAKNIFNYKGNVFFEMSPDPEYLTDNPNRRCPDINKARNVLGYKPSILVHDGVRRFLEFLKFENAK